MIAEDRQRHAQQHYVRLNDSKYLLISLVPYEGSLSNYTMFFRNTYKLRQAEIGKKSKRKKNAKQYPEAELLLF